MKQVWVILCVISSVLCQEFAYLDLQAYGSGSYTKRLSRESGDEVTESKKNHASSSCEWGDPPENAKSFMLCELGECEVTERDVYSKNGTIRITRCDPHHTLIQGYERDVCNNGEWSSSGHECVQCGKSPSTFDDEESSALIIGGAYSEQGDFPWMAALFMAKQNGSWSLVCGGTLISPSIVLSAAHCLDNHGRRTTTKEIKVGLGRLSSNFSSNEPGSIISSAKDIMLHEKYVGQNRQYDVDIALIVLEERVPTSDSIMPACIDWSGVMKPKHNDVGILAGWGLTEENQQSYALKWTHQKFMDYQQCYSSLDDKDRKFLSPDKFCADQVKGGMADRGDSGGGLTFVRDGVHYVYGLVSAKMATSTRQLRLYTNLMSGTHRAWLMDKWKKLQGQPRRAAPQSVL